MTDREPGTDRPDGAGEADEGLVAPEVDDADEIEDALDPDATAGEDDDEFEELEDTIVDRRGAAAGAAVPASRGPRRPAPAARSSAAAPTPSDAAVHIDDRVSKLFVIASVVVFVLILANAIFLGQGGLLSPSPTPLPSPTARPSPSATASPSGSASPSPSGSASPSPAGSASPSGSPAGSASPGASPSPSASG